MAVISLREYVREIEKQVDGGRNEEAIAHSRHVLESFPKHVDVYRLLGKAYLESQRFGDAGDIFQRVLSAAPDDFVSHVGMSIIREDEGNFDEAIWHMERAFDVQPSNSAIQEELRRLYGRRDNIEPPKIRLTRGALARMYYKGELYPQAIAEVRAALNENPDRLDLQGLLAEIYAKAGQRVEAVDMASQILRKLPFSLAANRIMVDMLIGSERESEIQTYYQRLSQLDPYAAHVTTTAPRAEDVPDQAIRLNKLDYKAGQPVEGVPGQPVWAATLGIEVAELATGREETLPEWLSPGPSTLAEEGGLAEGSAEGGAVPAFASDEVQAAEQPVKLSEAAGEEDQIPDWMKDLGWGPGGPESKEVDAALQLEEEPSVPAAPGALAAAEIPDWLKAMAPAEALPGEKEEEDVSPWLDQLFASEPQTGETTTQEVSGLTFLEGEAETPDWLKAGMAAGAAAAGAAMLGKEEEQAAEEFSEAAGEATPEPVPDWLAEIALESVASEEEVGEELPDWLRESLAPEAEAMQAAEGEVAGWTVEEGSLAEAIPAEEAPAEVEAEMVEELPRWLFEAEAAPTEVTPTEAAVERAEELPGWLFEAEAAPTEGAPTEAAAEMAEEMPGWLFEDTTAKPAEAGVEEGLAEAEEIPDWLKAAGVVAGTAAVSEVSEWLSEESAPEEAVEIGAEIEPVETIAAEELPELLREPGEAVPAEELPEWLREMGEVSEQVAGEAEMELEPGEAAPAEELPEWLREMGEVSEQVAGEVEMELEPGEAAPAEELPEWLREAGEFPEQVAAEAEMELEPGEAAPAEELPEWLRQPGEVAEITEAEPEAAFLAPAAAAMIVAAEETAPAQPEVAAPATESVEMEEAFAWLDSLLAPAEAEATAAAETPAAEPPGDTIPPLDEDAAFAWMESLAVRQGAQEALLLKPEDRLEQPPEWVKQAAESEPTQAEAAATEEAPAFEPESAGTQTFEEMPVDDEAAFAWLESLAVRQGAQEALLLKPEERRETPPDWLTAAATAGAAELAVDKIREEHAAPEQAVEAPVEEATPEPAAPTPAEATAEEPPELPDWLAEPSSETREETLEWTPPPLSRRKYDLNKITLVELERLPGIGFIMAQRVIDYRNTRGPFKKIDDLLNVPDFNLAALEGIRENLFLEAPVETGPIPGRIPTQPRPGTGPLVLATGAGLPKEVVKAREHLGGGYLDEALVIYDQLIRSKKHLSWVVEDLSEASNQYPTEFFVWQSLGDAYLRSDQASQALQAFIRAEKLLLP